jgi:hypothetical protein
VGPSKISPAVRPLRRTAPIIVVSW